jgi:hypothetical protein
MLLLLPLKLRSTLAGSYASSLPVREIAAVASEAKNQRNPGGWARQALEGRWREGTKISEEVEREVLEALKQQSPLGAQLAALPPPKPKRERLEGETETDFLKRIIEEKRKAQPQPAREPAKMGSPGQSISGAEA